jgi:uncharacterized membrane protein YqjE
MPKSSHSELLNSIALLGRTLIAIIHTRLHLLAVDLEEDRLQLLQMIKLMVFTMFCFAIGLILLTILIVILFWENHRVLALGVLSGIFLLTSLITWRYGLYKARQKPVIFNSSLGELLKDWKSLNILTKVDEQ